MSIEQDVEALVRRVIREELEAVGFVPGAVPAKAERRRIAPTQDHLTPREVCDIVPGMTTTNLAQLRFNGSGPKFLKPTPRTVVYRRADVIEWLENSERTSTAPEE